MFLNEVNTREIISKIHIIVDEWKLLHLKLPKFTCMYTPIKNLILKITDTPIIFNYNSNLFLKHDVTNCTYSLLYI